MRSEWDVKTGDWQPLRATIDRFERDAGGAELAVLVFDDEQQLVVPRTTLPPACQQGDVLTLAFRPDAAETQSRARRVQRLQARLFRVRSHVWIAGSVQGVMFRDSARQQARQAGVTGWVRNLPDGRVEAVFEGEESAVERLVEWCRHGPPGAFVRHVEHERRPATGEFETFTIQRTPY